MVSKFLAAAALFTTGCTTNSEHNNSQIDFAVEETLFYPRNSDNVDDMLSGIEANLTQQAMPSQTELHQLLVASSESFIDWDYICLRPQPGRPSNCTIGQVERFSEAERRAIHAFMQTRQIRPPLNRTNQQILEFWGAYRIFMTGHPWPSMNDCRSAKMCGVPTPPPPPVAPAALPPRP